MTIEELFYDVRSAYFDVLFNCLALCLDNGIEFDERFPVDFSDLSYDEDEEYCRDSGSMIAFLEMIAFKSIKSLFLKYGWKVDNSIGFFMPDESEQGMYGHLDFWEMLVCANDVTEDDAEYPLCSRIARIMEAYRDSVFDEFVFAPGQSYGHHLDVTVLTPPEYVTTEQLERIAGMIALKEPLYVYEGKLVIPSFPMFSGTDYCIDLTEDVAFSLSNMSLLNNALKNLAPGNN